MTKGSVPARLLRETDPRRRPWLGTVYIVMAALVLGGILMLLVGSNPLFAYRVLFTSSFGSLNGFAEMMVKACPLILAGLGITAAFRCRFWNIGAEGQIYMGAVAATVVGLWEPGLPWPFHLSLVAGAGFLAGAMYGVIPGALKAYWHVNEVITTLMLNYIAIYLTGYLVHNPMKDPTSGIPISAPMVESALLPILIPRTRFHLGILLALVMAVLIWALLQRTVLGYRIRAVGGDLEAARTGGIPVRRTIVWMMVVSGGLAGLAGMVEISGVQHRLIEGFSPQYGYVAIAVALLGNLKPSGVVLSGILFAVLLSGASSMQSIAGVPMPVIHVIQGLIILFVSARFIYRKVT